MYSLINIDLNVRTLSLVLKLKPIKKNQKLRRNQGMKFKPATWFMLIHKLFQYNAFDLGKTQLKKFS